MSMLQADIESAGYKDRKEVIRNIRFEVQPGELVGLIGPNGAGKSTTIKALLGLLPEIKGSIEFNENTPHYSYIPEQPLLYDELTLWEHLELAAAAMGLERQSFVLTAERLLRKYRLYDVRHHLPASFSKGMQQKIMLVIGFLHQPDIYIVDEPFIGLDPMAIKDFLEMLNEELRRGAGVLMCTHMLDTAERVCDSFILLSEGTIVAKGNLEEIRRESGLPGATLFDAFHKLLATQPNGERRP
ncbi:ABC transporter ATP-binding protein [Gorillibacterium massiliense]|uniref:ABC transporter ATP-binding protein n=1 Tax=Gorillibacterium massiliense TaxID=1280390 RepID=UPI000594542C|nr:ABC transporter ATP-binding protein [Gorillibacterium massiliense]